MGRRLAVGALAEHHGSATVEGLRRGHRERYLSAAVLEVLDGRPLHGYELYDVLVSSGFRMGDRAIVYHELHGLERTGLVASHLDVSSPGPARRVYALTTAGRHTISRRQGAAREDRAVDV